MHKNLYAFIETVLPRLIAGNQTLETPAANPSALPRPETLDTAAITLLSQTAIEIYGYGMDKLQSRRSTIGMVATLATSGMLFGIYKLHQIGAVSWGQAALATLTTVVGWHMSAGQVFKNFRKSQKTFSQQHAPENGLLLINAPEDPAVFDEGIKALETELATRHIHNSRPAKNPDDLRPARDFWHAGP